VRYGPNGRTLLALVCLWTAPGAQLSAQQGALRVELGVEPQEVTVGQPFHAALHVRAPAGVRVEYTEYAGGDSLQALAPLLRVAAPDGDTAAVYPLVAWVAGVPLHASVAVRLIEEGGTVRVQNLALRLPEVRSVLAGAAEPVEPRPPKGVVVPEGAVSGLPWWWWLVLLAALLVAALGYYFLARRPAEQGEEPVEPRSWALEQLEATEALAAAGRIEELHQRVGWIVRTYVHRTHPRLGPDLTSTEVVAGATRFGLGSDAVEGLGSILSSADRVKFARYPATRSDAESLIAAAREWVTAFPREENVGPVRRVA
jgi:hypothetical protein